MGKGLEAPTGLAKAATATTSFPATDTSILSRPTRGSAGAAAESAGAAADCGSRAPLDQRLNLLALLVQFSTNTGT